MKIKNIRPKTHPFTVEGLKLHTRILMRELKKNTDYILIQVKIHYDKEDSPKFLCPKLILHIKNARELRTLREMMCEKYGKLLTIQPDLKVEKIVVSYTETDKETYDTFVRNISMCNDIDYFANKD